MNEFNKEKIIKDLILLDKKLQQDLNSIGRKFELTLIGGAVFILKDKINRVTRDIDSFPDPEIAGYLQKNIDTFGIEVVAEEIVLRHPDYKKRREELNIDYSFKNLKIYVLSDFDLIISKFGRGTKRDRKDIIESGIIDDFSQTEKQKLDKLMLEALDYYAANPERVRSRWETFKKKHF